MITIDNKYKFGQVVYLHTDEDQKKRIVSGLVIRGQNIVYKLSCGIEESDHYDFEIATEKTFCN